MRLLGAALVLALAPPAASAAEPTMPQAFQGEWRAELKDCGSTGDDSRLIVTDSTLQFWESSGPIHSVEVLSPREIELTVRLEGEGEAWDDRMRWRLSEDGNALTDVTVESSEPFTRWKCPR